jgi:hypothetical protein
MVQPLTLSPAGQPHIFNGGTTMKGAKALSALAVFAVAGGIGVAVAGVTAAQADDTPPSLVEDYTHPGAAAILAEHDLKLFKGDGHILFDSQRTLDDGQCPVGLIQVEKSTAGLPPFGYYYCFKSIGTKGFLTLEVPGTFGVRGGTEDLIVKAKVSGDPNAETKEFEVEPNEPVAIDPGSGNDFPKAVLVEIRMS